MVVWRSRQPGHWPLVAGMGLPLGLAGVIGGYLVLGHWGPGLHFGLNVAIQAGLAVALATLAWWRWQRPEPEPGPSPAADHWLKLSAGWRWLIGLVLAWLAVRWLGILVEVVHRPLFPWDAWYAYGIQAKVWFFHPQLDVFANGWRWFEAQMPAWASGGTRHPPGIGLIQLWFLQALGRFDDALMNLAWPFALVSTGLVLFGMLRLAGAPLAVAVGTVAVIATLPIVNTQAVLAGYGDLWIALFVLVALSAGAMARWRHPRWLLVSMVAVAGMVSIKETGWLWVPVVGLGLAAGWMRLRWLALMVLLGAIAFAVVLWWLGEPIRVSTLGRLGFADGELVFPEGINLDAWRNIVMWPDLLRQLLVQDNWHLFWYLVPLVFAGGLCLVRADRVFAMASIVVWGGLAVLVAFFSFSSLGNSVIDGSSVNRLVLHLVPSIGLLAGLVAARWMPGQGAQVEAREVGHA